MPEPDRNSVAFYYLALELMCYDFDCIVFFKAVKSLPFREWKWTLLLDGGRQILQEHVEPEIS